MSLKKIDTVVPPSSASNVTTMVISPEKAGSTESKVIASRFFEAASVPQTVQYIYLPDGALLPAEKVIMENLLISSGFVLPHDGSFLEEYITRLCERRGNCVGKRVSCS